jgi:Tfp pilus assembly protein PilO
MKYFDDLLDNIDGYFANRSSKDKIYSYIMVVGGLGFLIYFTTYDLTAKMYSKANKERTNIVNTIKADKIYLRQNSAADVQFMTQQNSLLKKVFIQTKDMTGYIEHKITELSPLIYNETAWGKFLDSISDTAKINHIHLHNLRNLFVQKRDKFGHVLDLELEFSGSFHNTLRFINTLEKTPLVVDIHDMELMADETLVSKLKLAVWGISY